MTVVLRRSGLGTPGLTRAVAGAALGAAIGVGGLLAASAVGIRAEGGQLLGLGYVFALFGFLLGVGAFRFWLTWAAARPIDAAEEHAWHGTAGDWRRYFRFTTDHKVIGVQYLVTAFTLFVVAGSVAMLMRYELAQPGLAFDKEVYNTAMSTHGAMMITVALVSIIGGLGNYLVPLMVGARDMAFPKANALSFWMLPPAVVMVAINPLLGGFDSGWTAYPPLSQQANLGQQAYLMAFVTVGFSSILSSINFLTTVFRMRAPGMSLMRMPILVWALTVTATLGLIATSVVAGAFTMLLFDRVLGTSFFRASRGGDVILFQHLFWFYSHPAVYIMAVPGLGAILEIVPVFARKPLFAYPLAVLAFLMIGVMSFMVWAHHMFVSGMATFFHIPIMLTTELISVPTGVVFLTALGTIWMGRIRFKTPMLWVFGFLWAFLVGGITGVYLADVPTDITLSDTFFVVAHFHYTIIGATIYGLFAGTYFWFPKITGRMYDERLGKIHFWWFTIAFNLAFLPMFWLGIEGMRRRVADYPANLGPVNLFVSLMAANIALSVAVFLYNMIRSWQRGPKASPNPWNAQTLEWQTSSPPPVNNFDDIPVVTGTPYQYGSPPMVATPPSAAPAPVPGRPQP
ncbi:MAG TPA: cbb3-type cytochrome c oxidase subunit I [Candidatus Limnocylindria bacterium]|jgi:cytochrome c oxidase subunit I|nr:cbb3-type cytochrome c oxidase subunit I [Candidatus Limnocylindria bacterium]